jgi:hypothetical protein
MCDWIFLSGGPEGSVVASNWRSTYLLTPSHNLVVPPNSGLANESVTNLGKPDEAHQISLTVQVRPEHQPSTSRERDWSGDSRQFEFSGVGLNPLQRCRSTRLSG